MLSNRAWQLSTLAFIGTLGLMAVFVPTCPILIDILVAGIGAVFVAAKA